jgi:nicotinate-nucleotide adenylyltransferase
LIAFLGGTFDPVHLGHLHAARAVRDRLGCASVRFVLAARPSHRGEPAAAAADRWAILEAALAGESGLCPDDSELTRAEPSYTIETLEGARDRFGAALPLAWILGWDAYRTLPTWRRWRALLRVAHLVVVRRPGQDAALDPTMTEFTKAHAAADPAELGRAPGGRVLRLDADMLAISASDVRDRCRRGEPVAHLLPPAVWTYIRSRHLYGTEAPPRNVTSNPA